MRLEYANLILETDGPGWALKRKHTRTSGKNVGKQVEKLIGTWGKLDLALARMAEEVLNDADTTQATGTCAVDVLSHELRDFRHWLQASFHGRQNAA